MGHTPHLYLPPPWPLTAVPLPPTAAHHLIKVLRLDPGASVTYTDGAGCHGEGRLLDGTVVRGAERSVPPPTVAITIAVAPPHDKDRLRFMVEKLAELEVRRITFLRTRFGVGRLPDLSKSIAWATGALEQSQGAWLMEITTDWTELVALDLANSWFAERGGAEQVGRLPAEATIAIGPEGGWAPGEVPHKAHRLGLGRTVLRVETAAVVAAGIFRRQGSVTGPLPSQEKTV